MQRSIRSTERACLTTVQRNALGLGPLPVLASHASHRDARDAWNALGVGLRGASAPLLHCLGGGAPHAMQPPVRPTGCKDELGVSLNGSAKR